MVRSIALFVLVMGVTPAATAQEKTFVPPWAKDAIFYQIFPERFANGDASNDPPGTEPWGGTPTPRNYFGGDLKGIIDHLDYVSSLGVNALYLNPVFASNSNHKYHASDYMKIDPHFGDDAIFRSLVDECHRRGIRIILDGVFNHTGVDFPPFVDIKKNGARSAYLGWFNVYGLPLGPPNKPNYECWWGKGDLPKLMTTNPAVRHYLFDVTRHWMSFGIDGWRLDVPNEIPHDFWIEWRALVKSINPAAYIVGEIWDDATSWLEGDQFDAVMNYRFRRAVLDFFVGRTITATKFDSTLADQRAEYPDQVNYVLQNLLGSHDTERILTLCNGDTAAEMLAVLFQMTYVGAPMIYYGDEIGMTGGKDPGCRRTMEWDETKQDRGILQTYRQLIAMRNQHPALRRGSFLRLLADDAGGIYAFARVDSASTAIVVLNNGTSERRVRVPLPRGATAHRWTQIWPAAANDVETKDDAITVPVRGKTGVVYAEGRQ